MAISSTIVTVFGHSLEVCKLWARQIDKIPQEMHLILVDALIYPSPEIVSWLLWITHNRPNTTLITTYRNRFPEKVFVNWHGRGLDKALDYVYTEYFFTVDSDVEIKDGRVFEMMLKEAQSKNAVIVGCTLMPSALPYVHPSFALYKTEVAAKIKFHPEHYHPTIPEKYLQFWRKDMEEKDSYAPVRRVYLDIGQRLYLECKVNGMPIVDDFPVAKYVTHWWSGTPVVNWIENLKFGHELHKGKRRWL